MNLIKYSVLSLILFLVTFTGRVYAQKTLVDVKIDSAAILMGEQTLLHLSVTTDKTHPVQIVIPNDTLMSGVEVVNMSKPDTTLIENDRILIKQDILITSFDSALFLLPPFKVIDRTDTIYSNQVALKVTTVPVNIDKPEEFYDIKPIWAPPFVLADYYAWIYGILLALLIICMIGYIRQRLRNRQSILPFKKQAPKLPPYEQAMQSLNEIKERKLWQQGLSKDYYTQITDTLRVYIEERFGVDALEMTSAEILDALRKDNDVKPVYQNLNDLLILADFVKFAKFNPLPDENERSLSSAYLFVDQTKQKELPADSETEENKENSVETNEYNVTKE